MFSPNRLLYIITGFIIMQYLLFPYLRDCPSLILAIETIPYLLSFFTLRYAARKQHGHYRRFWSLLSWADILYILALLSWIVYDWVLGIVAPVPSIGDVFWNLQNITYVSALVYLLVKERSIYQGVRFLFDTLIVFIIVSIMSWEYVIHPQLAQLLKRTTVWGAVATSSYPVTDLVIFISLFMLFYTRRFPYPKKVFFPFASGFIVFVITDTLYLTQLTTNTYMIGGWIDPLYSASAMLVAIAGLSSTRLKPDTARIAVPQEAASKLRYLLPYSSAIVFLAFSVCRIDSQMMDAIFIASTATVALIVIRQITVLLENDKLMHKWQLMLGQAEFLASHDQLSLLPNRRMFEIQAAQDIDMAAANEGGQHSLAVLFFDLDRFKYVNDSYGHSTGDALIKAVAARLTALADKRHFVARMGGDEFTMLCKTCSEEELLELSRRIIEEISRPFQLEQGEVCTSASVGISVYPKDGTTVSALLRNADIALYKAKSLGKNRAVFYDEEFNQALSLKMAMVTDLRKALEQGDFILYYQPQIDTASQKLVGIEALIRWQKPSGIMVSPAEFIPLAEETGLIVPIGEWVIRTACNQAKLWMDEGAPAFHLSVNVSPRQFNEANFVDMVISVLETSGLPPELLVLEITEGIAIQEERETVEKLHRLKRLGVQIAMDDFGTGYSSLGYLELLQVDVLKMAQTFISEVSGDSGKASIVKAILAMASSLKLTVIAEGVETEEQFQFLKQHGCDWIQGYYFQKPLPADEMSEVFAGQAASVKAAL
ncbi:putative bifunctional diguanylate cyclase/phosphodiesterase [Paenibacillus sp. OAS669]|uniref:putative bifunctional diguanylate cyclase/phosphodiesterase n=1 Tax=Paenibacillus sp. OAS669 TaxID=2663821 RepID=UPI00178B6023|nr:EAL domain-containing protein [Paenibacillus sp. OAS669]MBE1440822.1 diguanylate cyclase (GGDEF)-like protein [Paenibacillus sp. OAS669]